MGMRSMLLLVVGAIVLAAPLQNNARAQGAYIGQIDGSSAPAAGHMPSPGNAAGPGVYLDQLPQSARPRAASPTRRVVRQKKTARIAAAPRRLLPDVGAGVTLAVPASVRDRAFPNVGKGTVGS